MNTKELKSLSLQVARLFAKEVEYLERSKGRFIKDYDVYNRLFYLDTAITYGAGEMALNIGIEIPAIEKLLNLVPGLEKRGSLTFGGPVFRFADLTEANLHDFVIKVNSLECRERAFIQLRDIWHQIAAVFFCRLSTSDGWLEDVNEFLRSGKTSSLRIPTLGRVCVVLMYATKGKEQAEAALRIFTQGTNGRRVQDLEQASNLLRLITEQPSILDELRKDITQASK